VSFSGSSSSVVRVGGLSSDGGRGLAPDKAPDGSASGLSGALGLSGLLDMHSLSLYAIDAIRICYRCYPHEHFCVVSSAN
jgi:hypothetical protein